MDEYDYAIKVWISQKYGDPKVTPEKIKEYEFDNIDGGHCETCEYTTMGIVFRMDGKGAWRAREIDMKYLSPAEFVREVSAIYQGLQSE